MQFVLEAFYLGTFYLLSNKQVAFKQHLLKVLLKEELITQPVYYKALELLKEEEKSNGIVK